MTELEALWTDLHSPQIWAELGVLALCATLAWALTWALRRSHRSEHQSILFGDRLVDGLMLPSLLWLFAYLAKLLLLKAQHVPVLKVALPILASLVVIRLTARVLRAVFPHSPLARLIERVVSWLIWAVAVLWITGQGAPLVQELESIELTFGKSRLSLRHLLDVVWVSALALVLTLWVSAALEQRVLKQAVSDLSLRRIAANTLRALLLLVGALVALSTLGVDLTALSVLGGALGVGLGFGLQKIAANYVSGFVILIERALRIGDYVRVDGFEGRVVDIKTRYTLVRAGNGIESVVPNEVLINQRVENLSLDSPKLLLHTQYVLRHDVHVSLAQAVMEAAALNAPRVLAEPAPSALLMDVALEGLRMHLYFWIDDAASGQNTIRSHVNIAVLQALRQAGIALAQPPAAPSPESPATGKVERTP